MIYKGRVSIVGDTDDPLPVNCEVTDHRLVIKTRDGSVIGDWGIRQIGAERDGDVFIIGVEGHLLRLTVNDPDAFADRVIATQEAAFTERLASAQGRSTSKPTTGRMVAMGVLAFVLGVGAVLVVLVLFQRGGDEPTEAAPTSTTTTEPPTTTTRVSSWIRFEVDVYDYFDWVEGANHEGDTCIAVDDFFLVSAGVNVVIRDASTGVVVTSAPLRSGQLSIEPGMEGLPDDELDLFWRCVFATQFESESITSDGVYDVGIEGVRHTLSGSDLLSDESFISFFDTGSESERELIRIGG